MTPSEESLDDAYEGDDEDQEDASASDENESQPIKDLRKSQKNWEKKSKRLERELQAEREIRVLLETEKREASAKAEFARLGLSEKQVALFLKEHEGDVSPEAVEQFVETYDLTPKVEEDEGQPTPKSRPVREFKPGGDGTPVSGGAKQMTRPEWEKLYFSGPEGKAKATELLYGGKVDMSV